MGLHFNVLSKTNYEEETVNQIWLSFPILN